MEHLFREYISLATWARRRHEALKSLPVIHRSSIELDRIENVDDALTSKTGTSLNDDVTFEAA